MKKNIITIIISLIIIISLNKPSTVEAFSLKFSCNGSQTDFNGYSFMEFNLSGYGNLYKSAYCLEAWKSTPCDIKGIDWTVNKYNYNSKLGRAIAYIMQKTENTISDADEKTATRSFAFRLMYSYANGYPEPNINYNNSDYYMATYVQETAKSAVENNNNYCSNNSNITWKEKAVCIYLEAVDEYNKSIDFNTSGTKQIKYNTVFGTNKEKLLLISNFDLTDENNVSCNKNTITDNVISTSQIDCSATKFIIGSEKNAYMIETSKFGFYDDNNPYEIVVKNDPISSFSIYTNEAYQTMLVENGETNSDLVFQFWKNRSANDCDAPGTYLDPSSKNIFDLAAYKRKNCLCVDNVYKKSDYYKAVDNGLRDAYLEQCPAPDCNENKSCSINSNCNNTSKENIIEEGIDYKNESCLANSEILDKYLWYKTANNEIYCNEKIELDYPILNEYKVGLGGRLDIKINTEVTLNCIVSGDTVDLSELVKNNEFNKLDKINFTFDDKNEILNLTDGQKKFSLKSSNSNGFYDYNNDGKIDIKDASFLISVAAKLKSLPSGKEGDLDGDGNITTSDARILLIFVSNKNNYDNSYDYNNDGRINELDKERFDECSGMNEITISGGSTFTVKYNAVYASSNIPLTSVSTGRIIINSNNKNDIIVPKDNGTGYYISYNTAYGKYEFSINLDLSEHNISLNDLLGKETNCSANYACSYEYTYGYSCIKDKVEYLIPEECNTDEDIKACYKRLCGCECPNCDTPEDKEGNDINYFYRPITLNDVFPNSKTDYSNKNNLSKSRIPGSNWTDEKGLKTQEEIETKGEQIYNNDNANFNNDNTIHYSFTLTPSTMKKIREYNNRQEKESDGYADFTLYCEEGTGLKCESNFLTNLLNVKNYGSYTYLMSSYKQFDFGNYKNSSADLALLNNARKQWQTYTDGTAWK